MEHGRYIRIVTQSISVEGLASLNRFLVNSVRPTLKREGIVATANRRRAFYGCSLRRVINVMRKVNKP